MRGSAAEVARRFAGGTRGEIVLVIGPAETGPAEAELEAALDAVERLVEAGARRRAAAQVVSSLTGLPANRLYKIEPLMDLDEYRQQSYETWEKMSAGWHSWREFMWDATSTVREWLISSLDPQPGQTILDVAAGVGDTGFAAASKTRRRRAADLD